MKFLYVEDDDNIRQLYTMHLENCFKDVVVVECTNSQHAIDTLAKHDDIGLIISDYDMPGGSGGEFYSYLVQNKIKIPFVLFSTHDYKALNEFEKFMDYNKFNSCIKKPMKGQMFKDHIVGLLKKMGNPNGMAHNDKFQKVRLIHFYRYNKVLCDVYLKLSDKKYVKVINKDETYTRDDIEKYLKKKQKYLYINSEDYDSFSVSFAKTPFLIESDEIPDEKLPTVISSTIEIIGDVVRSVGVSDQVVSLVGHTVKQIEKDSKKKSDISDLLRRLKNRKDYLSDHSYMTAHIATAMAMEIEWITPDMIEKLTIASILHDLTLDNPEIALEYDLEEHIDKDKYTTREVEEFYSHPQDISKLINQNDKLPPNIAEIIMSHHENPEGHGFPRKIGPDHLSKLSTVFNVAHYFVIQMYRYGLDDSDYIRILLQMKERYRHKAYADAIKALVKTLKKIEGVIAA